MFKKIIICVLTVCLAGAIFAACGKSNSNRNTQSTTNSTTQSTTQSTTESTTDKMEKDATDMATKAKEPTKSAMT